MNFVQIKVYNIAIYIRSGQSFMVSNSGMRHIVSAMGITVSNPIMIYHASGSSFDIICANTYGYQPAFKTLVQNTRYLIYGSKTRSWRVMARLMLLEFPV